MKTLTKRNPRVSGAVRTMVATVALAIALGGITTAVARADDDRGHDDRGRHEERRHQEREHRDYVYHRPGVYYAPPPVQYYAPPAPSPVIDFVFPLHIR